MTLKTRLRPPMEHLNHKRTVIPPQQVVLGSSRSGLPPGEVGRCLCWPGSVQKALFPPCRGGLQWRRGLRVRWSHLDMHYESVTFSSLITPTAGWSGLWQEAPGGQILLTARRAQGLECLLSSVLVSVAISGAGRFPHCDEGHALHQAWPPWSSPNPCDLCKITLSFF